MNNFIFHERYILTDIPFRRQRLTLSDPKTQESKVIDIIKETDANEETIQSIDDIAHQNAELCQRRVHNLMSEIEKRDTTMHCLQNLLSVIETKSNCLTEDVGW
jgi:hypothetical protein